MNICHRKRRYCWLILLIGVLQGCQGLAPYMDEKPRVRRPVSIERRPSVDIIETRPADQQSTAPVTMAADEVKREPPVVLALLKTAEDQKLNQAWEDAAGTIERALRISPDSPAAYLSLAQVRIKQGHFNEAEQLCRKGLLYVEPRSSIKSRLLYNQLWRNIAEIRLTLNDPQGAKAARQQLLK